jgi:hypothetical protein
VSSAKQQPLYTVLENSVITVPSWMPKGILLFLQRFRPFVFNCETIGLALAGSFSDHAWARFVAAFLYSTYHLVESSGTNRHGEYPVLYTMWAMCIPDLEYRHACAWGIAINFILSSGYSKLAAGGWSSSGTPLWLHSSTMETYLTCYREARTRFDRPVFSGLNELVSKSRALTRLISLAILLLELMLVPASLAMPPSSRPLACYALIGMHVGIVSLMSFKVGVAFFTTIPVYLYAFDCDAEIGTKPWLLAALLGLGPTLCSVLLIPIPENWPFTPVSLFMWDGKAAQILLRLLMIEDTRMVFATKKVASEGIEGLKVLHHGEVLNDNEDAVVHDCVLKTIGFTMIQGGDAMVEAVWALKQDPKISSTATRAFLHRTWATLTLDRRLVEVHTGEDLLHVYLVRVDDDMRVSDVIM